MFYIGWYIFAKEKEKEKEVTCYMGALIFLTKLKIYTNRYKYWLRGDFIPVRKPPRKIVQ